MRGSGGARGHPRVALPRDRERAWRHLVEQFGGGRRAFRGLLILQAVEGLRGCLAGRGRIGPRRRMRTLARPGEGNRWGRLWARGRFVEHDGRRLRLRRARHRALRFARTARCRRWFRLPGFQNRSEREFLLSVSDRGLRWARRHRWGRRQGSRAGRRRGRHRWWGHGQRRGRRCCGLRRSGREGGEGRPVATLL